MFDFILRFEFFYQYSELAKRQRAVLKILHGFTDNVIQKRRQELLAISINNNKTAEELTNENDDIGIKSKSAFLDVLLQSKVNGKLLQDFEVREEVDTFMFEVNFCCILIFFLLATPIKNIKTFLLLFFSFHY